MYQDVWWFAALQELVAGGVLAATGSLWRLAVEDVLMRLVDSHEEVSCV